MHMSSDLITNLLFAGKESSLQACNHRYNYVKGTNKCRNNANDSFGTGFDVLKDHVLNHLMTGHCPSKSLQLRPKFHSLFLQNSSDFQTSVILKHLNHHLECIDVSFNLKTAPSPKLKRDTQTE